MQENALSLSSNYWNQAAQRTSLCLRALKVRVRFTRDGLKQLSRLRRLPGSTLLLARTISRELALYIAAHEAKNIHFDIDCWEVTYQSDVRLVLRKEQGVWFVTDVIGSKAVRFSPVFVWKQLKRGCELVLARVLVGWRNATLLQGGLR